MGITGARWRCGGYHQAMATEQPRADASNRERSPDHEFTLSLGQVADLYADAGLPRTLRAIQKYCALGKLDARKTETETGEQWLVASYSVERHIAYINEVRTAATTRAQTRTGTAVRTPETEDGKSLHTPEQTRTDAAVHATDDRYVQQLESDNEFLRAQIGIKDQTIGALLERDKETNILLARLQDLLSPRLDHPRER